MPEAEVMVSLSGLLLLQHKQLPSRCCQRGRRWNPQTIDCIEEGEKISRLWDKLYATARANLSPSYMYSVSLQGHRFRYRAHVQACASCKPNILF